MSGICEIPLQRSLNGLIFRGHFSDFWNLHCAGREFLKTRAPQELLAQTEAWFLIIKINFWGFLGVFNILLGERSLAFPKETFNVYFLMTFSRLFTAETFAEIAQIFAKSEKTGDTFAEIVQKVAVLSGKATELGSFFLGIVTSVRVSVFWCFLSVFCTSDWARVFWSFFALFFEFFKKSSKTWGGSEVKSALFAIFGCKKTDTQSKVSISTTRKGKKALWGKVISFTSDTVDFSAQLFKSCVEKIDIFCCFLSVFCSKKLILGGWQRVFFVEEKSSRRSFFLGHFKFATRVCGFWS